MDDLPALEPKSTCWHPSQHRSTRGPSASRALHQNQPSPTLGKNGKPDSLKRARETPKELIPSRAVSSGRGRTSPGLPKHYTINAVAEALDVSSRTVRRWIANGDLIVHRFDGLVRVEDGDLRSFLALHREG